MLARALKKAREACPSALTPDSEHVTMYTELRQYLARDLFDRGVRGAQVGQLLRPEQHLRQRHFLAALLDGRVARAGFALRANLLQADRVDRSEEHTSEL